MNMKNTPKKDALTGKAPPKEQTLDPEDWQAFRTLAHQALLVLFTSFAPSLPFYIKRRRENAAYWLFMPSFYTGLLENRNLE